MPDGTVMETCSYDEYIEARGTGFFAFDMNDASPELFFRPKKREPRKYVASVMPINVGGVALTGIVVPFEWPEGMRVQVTELIDNQTEARSEGEKL